MGKDEEFKIKEDPKKPPSFMKMAVEAIANDEMAKYQTARIDMFIGTLLRVKGLIEMEQGFAKMMDKHMDDLNDLEEDMFDTMAKFVRRKKNGVRKCEDGRSD